MAAPDTYFFRLSDFLSRYYRGRPRRCPAEREFYTVEDVDESESALHSTGEDLITRIQGAIGLRRSVLVTGPRGCGKSYCCDQAIRRARDAGSIGGWHFLQGNREIPRDYLSEDMLVVRDGGLPELIPALALRPNGIGPARDTVTLVEWLLALTGANPGPRRTVSVFRSLPEWPAIPAAFVEGPHEAAQHWEPSDWTVLFLDEINRFGDGFLDSLLALTEEGKIVRRGQEYFVPLVVVATANPPGYDLTAKKLSPPLQARIARSYRVAQPSREDLVRVVLHEAVLRFQHAYRHAAEPLEISRRLQYLAAAATLCLWGSPRAKEKGIYFLLPETQEELDRAMELDPTLQLAMATLTQLVTFGPDSRAVADWMGAAVNLAVREAGATARHPRPVQVAGEHLERTAVEVLGHKVRESFNEGTDPALSGLKEHCIRTVVRQVLNRADLQRLFYPYQALAASLFGPVDERLPATVADHFAKLSGAHRKTWLAALAHWSERGAGADPAPAASRVRQALQAAGWLDARGILADERAREWFSALLRLDSQAVAAEALHGLLQGPPAPPAQAASES